MRKSIITAITLLPAAFGLSATAALVAHFPMDGQGGRITETVSGYTFDIHGHFAPEIVPGAVDGAMRFDGYTSYVDTRLENILPAGNTKMTFSLWAAVPCYPIVEIDVNTREQVAIASCLDESAKTGFGFFIGFDGKYSFRSYVGGWPVNIEVSEPLPTYTWNNLVAVVDTEAMQATLYNNGRQVGTARCSGTVTYSGGRFRMGRGPGERYAGPFLLTSYNGLIDDVSIWNEAIDAKTITSWKPQNPADLSIPASRFANDILRPRFHGMPAAAWTNESHGMTYSDGKFHVFFQKNGDGPYMARLHWGHLVSENLYDWTEEKIAIAPGAPYDIKGCWSGCVFSDDAITGGKPNILYTGVDYGRATIDQAMPESDDLLNWTKSQTNPIINGRPGSLTDDFRDPYFFRNGDNAYIIVGSSKDGVGTTSLHRYNAASKTWSNDGALFFTGSTANADGSFWEMPTISKIGDKWLFTATPLNTGTGVRTMYWTGSINADGTFNPSSRTSKNVELNSRDGFGLLSPTIYNHNGKTIALGIVPDKLGSQENWNLGWAHCYSLPREWSLDNNGNLVQRPYESLTGLRTATAYSKTDYELDGTVSLNPVSGREVEISATATLNGKPFGFNIFKGAGRQATITYNPQTGSLTADFSQLERLINDGGVYDGKYVMTLPEFPKRGTDLKINIFIDHSILDIFVNDRWASSIRVFPTNAESTGIEAFATKGAVTFKELRAWNLGPEGGYVPGAVEGISADNVMEGTPVYDMNGMLVQRVSGNVNPLSDLEPGVYVVNGKKHIVR